MLRRKSTSVDKPCETIDTLIGQKAEFTGDLQFEGGLRIDGIIRGSLGAREDTNSTLVLSESGEIHGDVRVPHVIINGVVNGNVHSVGRVELQGKARINGDVNYKAIEMELGATVNGSLVCNPTGKYAEAPLLKSVPDGAGRAMDNVDALPVRSAGGAGSER
jgi:cytoskeletal protein CcmA (bactofilin family)